MAKPSIQELAAYLDPLQSDFYELIIPNLPGTGNQATRELRVACQQVSLPSKMIEPVPAEMAGNQLQYAGRSQYDHDVNIVFVENRRMSIHKSLRNYLEYIRGHERQLGHYKRDYQRDATLVVYDQMGLVIDRLTMYGLWLSNLGEYQFDGSGSNIITVNTTWQVDYWHPEDGFAGSGAVSGLSSFLS